MRSPSVRPATHEHFILEDLRDEDFVTGYVAHIAESRLLARPITLAPVGAAPTPRRRVGHPDAVVRRRGHHHLVAATTVLATLVLALALSVATNRRTPRTPHLPAAAHLQDQSSPPPLLVDPVSIPNAHPTELVQPALTTEPPTEASPRGTTEPSAELQRSVPNVTPKPMPIVKVVPPKLPPLPAPSGAVDLEDPHRGVTSAGF